MQFTNQKLAYMDDGLSKLKITFLVYQNGGWRESFHSMQLAEFNSFVLNFIDFVQIQKNYPDSINLNGLGFIRRAVVSYDILPSAWQECVSLDLEKPFHV